MATTMTDRTFGARRESDDATPGATTLAASGRSMAAAPGVEYRLVYGTVFAVCFVLAALLRLVPRRLHPWIAPSERSMSLAAEARAAADATVPFVFQVS